MGKCSGLKAGGHHRKAIDVANKKRNEKQSIKKEKEAAGKRAIALQEILSGKLGSMYTDCDIYLQQQVVNNDGSKEGGGGTSSASNIELCREHFRYENCSNRRCKFSHEYTIVDALQNVISGTNTTTNNDNSDYDGSDDNNNSQATIPALQFLPGIITTGGGRQKRPHRSRLVMEHNVVEDGVSSLQLDDHNIPSPLENLSIVNTIITYVKSNNDVLNLALTCRYMHQTILFDENGCPDVTRRKQRVKESQLEERNNSLLANSKSTGGRLRYVVGYVEGGLNNSTKGGSKKKGNNKKANKNRKNDTASTYCTEPPQRRRPVLIYDYENPNVFVAFREYALSVANTKSTVMLEESQNENNES